MWSTRWNALPWLAAAVAIAALACGSEPEQTQSESATRAMSSEMKTPLAAGPKSSTELPENFPEDIPQYPGARLIKVRFSPDGGLAVSFSTDKDVDDVIDYFADSFAAEGWSTQVRDMPPGRAVFADKDQRIASVMSREVDEGTSIELLLYEIQ